MRRAAITLATLGLLFAALPAALAQETGDIVITLSGNLFAAPGSITQVYAQEVPAELVGQTCDGFAMTENNASEWDFNDLIIASGGSTVEILDYEAVAEGTTFTNGTLTLGGTLTVSVRMGPGGVSSEGLLIVLNCAQPPPPTTTTTTTEAPTVTTTTVPPTVTTQPPTDTTEPPPEGGIEAGGGSTAGTGTNADAFVGAGVLALAAALGILFVSRQIASKRE